MIVQLLAGTRRGLTVRELHDRLVEGGYQCDARTVRRDLGQLAEVGETRPVEDGRWTVAGRPAVQGGLPVRQEEIIALLVAEQRLAPLGDVWLAGALAELRVHALALMTEAGREFCLAAAKMIVANPRACVHYAGRAELFEKLEQACHEDERVKILHRSGGKQPRERVIEPRRLLFRDGALYVIARDSETGEHKKFALHRIERAETLHDLVEPDPDFDPDAYADASFGLHHGEPLHAVVEFDERVAHLFEERQFHASQRVKKLSSGIRVAWDVSGSTDLVRWLAGFAGHVRVVEPARLRDELRDHHRRALEALDG